MEYSEFLATRKQFERGPIRWSFDQLYYIGERLSRINNLLKEQYITSQEWEDLRSFSSQLFIKMNKLDKSKLNFDKIEMCDTLWM